MDLAPRKAKTKLCFLYRKSSIGTGSQDMRVQQLARILETCAPDRFEISLRPITFSRLFRGAAIQLLPRDCVFFASKQVLTGLDTSDFVKLKKRGIAVVADYVDANIDCMPVDGIDVHLAASVACQLALKELIEKRSARGEARLLLHNVDERLPARSAQRSATSLSLLYVGANKNTVMSDAIKEQVDFRPGGSADEFLATLRAYESANAHYCVRPEVGEQSVRRYKPFTKGFTAARCGAAIIVNRSADDAVHFLGEDYPYLCDRPEETDILNTIAHMKDDVGGPTWNDALDRVSELAERIRPERLAADMAAVIEELVV